MIWLSFVCVLASVVVLASCGAPARLGPAAAPQGPVMLPPPSETALPEAPPAGVQLRLTGAQKAELVELLLEAQAAFARGAYEAAEHTWLAAAVRDPSNVDARLGLGRVWLLRGVAGDDASFRARAREAFAFVVQACPEHAQARRLLQLLPAEPVLR